MEPTSIRPEEGIIIEPVRRTAVVRQVDVLVCGGGVAGIGAALGAARAGAKTMVIERNAFLGGAATGVLMNTWNVPVARMNGIAQEIARELAARGSGVDAGPTFPFDPEGLKELAVEKLRDNGVEILNYTWVVDAVMEDQRIRGVVIQNKSGRQAILAKCVIDTTGDADVAAAAGAEYVKGREEDGKMRPMSVLFRLGGVDVRRVVEYCRSQPPENFTADPNFHILKPEEGLVRFSGFFDIAERARANGELPDEVHYLRMEGVDVERGIVTVNNSRVYGVDGTNAWDITRGDLESRMQNRRIMKVIKRDIPGFENAFVIDSSQTVGVRETRRVRGAFVLTQADNAAQRRFPDSAARIWRHMAAGRDWHKATGGEGAPGDEVYRTATTNLTYFEIPWRVFVPNGVQGMTVGGRVISVSHDADMWTRGQYCCLVTGQVAGVGAALAAKRDTVPGALDIGEIQAALQAQSVDIGSAGRNDDVSAPVQAV